MNYGKEFKEAEGLGLKKEASLYKKRFIENELLSCIKISAPEIINLIYRNYDPEEEVLVLYDDGYQDSLDVSGMDLHTILIKVVHNLKI